jgi:Outer membrane protein beta-barrel domain
VFKTMLIGITILACASLAVAQSDDYRKFEFFGGYSYNEITHGIGTEGIGDDPTGFKGFNTSIARIFSRHVGLKFDFSGHFNNRTIPFATSGTGIDLNARIYNFLGGIQVKHNSTETNFKPFVHALVGAAHIRNRVDISNDVCIAVAPAPCPPDFTEKDTGFAAAIGGGIDIGVNDRIDIRVIQVDYNPTRVFDSRQKNLRLGIGIVIH